MSNSFSKIFEADDLLEFLTKGVNREEAKVCRELEKIGREGLRECFDLDFEMGN
jgi:hypothetical protein